jgi:nitrate reductase / nitrite oxidoreductase, alpha subunit
MSHFLDRLTFFRKQVDTFADGHGIVTNEPREWEDGYRKRWQHDKIVRSTHGVNCTGSCSWKIYVKGGIVTWEPSRPITPGHAPICRTMNRVAAPAALATRGICIPPTG